MTGAPSPPQRSLGPILAPALVFAVLALVAVLERKLTREQPFRLEAGGLKVVVPDASLAALGRGALRDLQLIDRPLPMDDPRLEPHLIKKAEAHPLVVSAGPLERRWPDRATLPLQLREPVAAVIARGHAVLVDADAVVCSRVFRLPAGRRIHVPLIEPPAGSLSAFPARGRPFRNLDTSEPGHAAVHQALNALISWRHRALRDHPMLRDHPVDRIRVGDGTGVWEAGTSSLWVKARRLPEVFWGHPPDSVRGSGVLGEKEKFDRLDRIARLPGAVLEGTVIDVTVDDPTFTPVGAR